MYSLRHTYFTGGYILLDPAIAEMLLSKHDQFFSKFDPMTFDQKQIASLFGTPAKAEKVKSTGIIPVKGVIGRDLMPIERMMGGVDLEDVKRDLRNFEQDPGIKKIIFNIDSPGGTASGVPEMASLIRNSTKHTETFTENRASSAGYWLGSQGKRFLATSSASVGNVGVFKVVANTVDLYSKMGVKMELFRSGKYKAIGLPGTAIDEAGKELLQSEVESIHQEFKDAIKSVRTLVPDWAMEGQSFSAKKASEIGMITGLVSGIDELIV